MDIRIKEEIKKLSDDVEKLRIDLTRKNSENLTIREMDMEQKKNQDDEIKAAIKKVCLDVIKLEQNSGKSKFLGEKIVQVISGYVPIKQALFKLLFVPKL